MVRIKSWNRLSEDRYGILYRERELYCNHTWYCDFDGYNAKFISSGFTSICIVVNIQYTDVINITIEVTTNSGITNTLKSIQSPVNDISIATPEKFCETLTKLINKNLTTS